MALFVYIVELIEQILVKFQHRVAPCPLPSVLFALSLGLTAILQEFSTPISNWGDQKGYPKQARRFGTGGFGSPRPSLGQPPSPNPPIRSPSPSFERGRLFPQHAPATPLGVDSHHCQPNNPLLDQYGKYLGSFHDFLFFLLKP